MIKVHVAGLTAAVVLTTALVSPAAAKPVVETIWTTHGVGAELYNPCTSDEYITLAGYVELDTTRRYTSSGGLQLRAVMRPLQDTWHWYGYRTTDEDFDPTLPRIGDPDTVYTVQGQSRVRGTIPTLPGTLTLHGTMTVSGPGPSNGITVLYSVQYVHDAEGMVSAEVVALSVRCSDGTVWPVDVTYFP